MDLPIEFSRHLFETGAFLIITGCPIGTEIGIDLQSYKTDLNFRGIKMIPPGPHFVFTSSIGQYDDKTSLRVGFIHYFKKQEIIIREWDHEKEELRIRTKVDSNIEIQRIREHIKDLDKYLAPYDYTELNKWNHLTNHITENIIKYSSPDTGIIKSSADYESCPDSERPRGNNNYYNNNNNNKHDEDDNNNNNNTDSVTTPTSSSVKIPLPSTSTRITIDESMYLPNLKIVPGTIPKFTIVPKRYTQNASPSEISFSYLDTIIAINKFMDTFLGKSFQLLEEIQFSFIIFLIGYSVEGLAHWKNTLNLLSNSEIAIEKYLDFYRQYLLVLKYQLPELPIELMLDTQFNPIYNDIKKLLHNCGQGDLLKIEAINLMNNLKMTMNWKFNGVFDIDPEDMPIIVENI